MPGPRKQSDNFSLVNETTATLPNVAFGDIKDDVLGQKYKLNLIIVDSSKIKHLNTVYRNKEKPTDILSFPMDENEGEIYMSLDEVRSEAKKFDRTYENFFAFLFIHGCVHLKGHEHGATMESIEEKVRRKFGI